MTPTLERLAGFDAHLIDRVTNKVYFIENQSSQLTVVVDFIGERKNASVLLDRIS